MCGGLAPAILPHRKVKHSIAGDGGGGVGRHFGGATADWEVTGRPHHRSSDGAAGTALAELLAEAIARQNMRSAPSLPAAVSCCRKRSSLDSWAHLKGRGEGLLGAGVSNLRQFECR